MLTIRATTGGAGYAQRHLEHSDYYDEHRRVQGVWRGRGAELLGLHGNVSLARKATQALLFRLNGESPRAEVEAASFGPLLDRYIEQELSERIQLGDRIFRTSEYTSGHVGENNPWIR